MISLHSLKLCAFAMGHDIPFAFATESSLSIGICWVHTERRETGIETYTIPQKLSEVKKILGY